MASRKKAALFGELNNSYQPDEFIAPTPHPHSKEGVALNKKSNALIIKLDHLITIKPLTANQASFFDAYKAGYYCCLLFGAAGTGKSYLSVFFALEDVLSRDTPYDKLIIVRSNISTGAPVGFLPGSIEEKMAMYELPYKSICESLFNRKDAYDRLKEQGKIEFMPATFLRGTTFNNSIVIADEVQNFDYQSFKTLITRIGHDSKLLMIGDYKQNDLNKSKYEVSGLPKMHQILKMMPEFTSIEFTTDDIVRSSMVKNFIIAEERWEFDNEK